MSEYQPYGQQPSFEPTSSGGYGRAVQPAGTYEGVYPQQVPDGYPAHGQHRAAGKQYGLHGAEPFWYLLGCIYFGVAYFSKLPAKKAACEVFSELQLDGQGPSHGYSMSGAATFWYYLMCLAFGSGYFSKVSAKKAMWEVIGIVQSAPGEYGAAIGRVLSGSAQPPRRGF